MRLTFSEFHNLFEGKVDEEEHLVSDYACAWVKDVSILQRQDICLAVD